MTAWFAEVRAQAERAMAGPKGMSVEELRWLDMMAADLAELLPATIELALLSILVGIVVGVGLGIASVVVPRPERSSPRPARPGLVPARPLPLPGDRPLAYSCQ